MQTNNTTTTANDQSWREDAPSFKQGITIRNLMGCDIRPCGLNKGQASDILSLYFSRDEKDKAKAAANREEAIATVHNLPGVVYVRKAAAKVAVKVATARTAVKPVSAGKIEVKQGNGIDPAKLAKLNETIASLRKALSA